jgi:SAM-dependent methyltransferase
MSSVQTISAPALKIVVRAEREVADESPDHLVPVGTRRDNSTNQRFNDKLYKLYDFTRQLKILDLGCSGGGFVKNCFDDGHVAVGLEGSDYSKRFGRAEWRTIPELLFTCDVTGEFEIFMEAQGRLERLQFDVVTSWEVMEHIAARDLPRVAANVKKHLAPGGLWIMSVSPRPDVYNGVNLHQTVQPKSWWIEQFRQLGLEQLEEYVIYFNTQWVRGPKFGYSDGSFHLVLGQDRADLPPVPRQGLLRWVYDRWRGSMPQKFLAGDF